MVLLIIYTRSNVKFTFLRENKHEHTSVTYRILFFFLSLFPSRMLDVVHLPKCLIEKVVNRMAINWETRLDTKSFYFYIFTPRVPKIIQFRNWYFRDDCWNHGRDRGCFFNLRNFECSPIELLRAEACGGKISLIMANLR